MPHQPRLEEGVSPEARDPRAPDPAAETAPAAPAKRVKAIGLLSGGLDSTLAAKVLKEQGIDVVGVQFSTGFCVTDHRRAVAREDDDPRRLRNEALRAGADLGVPVEVVDISEEYRKIITRPKHGYGKNVNPCIDCRAFMLSKAKELMEREGADFVFTGEVLGQRPMSQRRDAMRVIEKESGLEGKLLRPLSAQLLAETPMEREGLVDRERLLAISGRSRKTQLRLIQEAGIEDVPTPAGGCCYLADENFARKFRDLVSHRDEELRPDELMLLKLGRHFRVSERVKVVCGRDERENEFLERYIADRWWFQALEFGSSLAVTDDAPDGAERETICRIVARYCQGRAEADVAVRAVPPGAGGAPEWGDSIPAPLPGEERPRVAPMPPAEIDRMRV